MSNYPNGLDDDSTILRVDDNLAEIGSTSINQIRSAIFAVETELGLNPAGSAGTLATRLNVAVNADGTLKTSAILAAGALTGQIVDATVHPTAAIAESKLALTYSTQSLFNQIGTLTTEVNTINDVVSDLSLDFIKHLTGINTLSTIEGRHVVSHIDLNDEPSDTRDVNFVWPSGTAPRDRLGLIRGTNLGSFLWDINDEFVRHQKSDGTVRVDAVQYAHPASAVSVEVSGFVTVPSTVDNLQEFAEYVDRASFSATSTHQQSHHANGISRSFRGTPIGDGYGQLIVPFTSATTYLVDGYGSSPIDNNLTGDNIIEFTPPVDSTFYFDSLFAQVRTGDIITVNYGTVEAQHLIESVRFDSDNSLPPNRKYIVRINGRNIEASTTAVARIDRSSYSEEKFGVITTAYANNVFGAQPSLIVANPKGASVLGIGFDASKFDGTHYKLYLALYPTGNPKEKTLTLPAIDVTGDLGAKPGSYTLESVVTTTNEAFRKAGFNYRFVAFSYNGEFGIMLADSYGGASFSIVSGVLDLLGVVQSSVFTENVVGDAAPGAIDPLGFGGGGANVASPAFRETYSNITQAKVATKVITPLNAKNYTVNGAERSSLRIVSDGYTDQFGDGYWGATIIQRTVVPGQTVRVRYEIPLDLRAKELFVGKTIVVQPELGTANENYNDLDYGRFTISNVEYSLCNDVCDKTYVEVYNGIHAFGFPIGTIRLNIPVRLHFTDDSVSFSNQHLKDAASTGDYKRHFEIYVDESQHTFSHERARFSLTGGGEITKLNIVKVSSRLRGVPGVGSGTVSLSFSSYDGTTGAFSAQLIGRTTGPLVTGQKGQVTRFYDGTYIDFIDVIFDIKDTVNTFVSTSLSIELFPSLKENQIYLYLGSVQLNDQSSKLTHLVDGREFGNVSEQDLSSSALDYIGASDRHLKTNGVIRGFDYESTSSNRMLFSGGVALVNGKFTYLNDFTASVPFVRNHNSGTPTDNTTWVLCVNTGGQPTLVLLADDVPGRRVLNTVNGQNYVVQALTYSEIFSGSRKDLTPLYLVYSVCTNSSSISFTRRDLRQLPIDVGAKQVTPSAILTIDNDGTPTVTSVRSLYNTVDVGRFSLTYNGIGDVTVSWNQAALPPTNGQPIVSVCDSTVAAYARAFTDGTLTSPSIRVITNDGTGLVDCNFVLAIY